MAEHILFLTGRLARPRLEKVLAELTPAPFAWTIADMGVKVAALMTEAIILRRLDRDLVARASRVVVPGRCRADLERLASGFGCAFERGPDEVRDIPEWLAKKARRLCSPRNPSGFLPRSWKRRSSISTRYWRAASRCARMGPM